MLEKCRTSGLLCLSLCKSPSSDVATHVTDGGGWLPRPLTEDSEFRLKRKNGTLHFNTKCRCTYLGFRSSSPPLINWYFSNVHWWLECRLIYAKVLPRATKPTRVCLLANAKTQPQVHANPATLNSRHSQSNILFTLQQLQREITHVEKSFWSESSALRMQSPSSHSCPGRQGPRRPSAESIELF